MKTIASSINKILPSEMCKVYRLFYQKRKTIPEIAKELDIPYEDVQALKQSALIRLKYYNNNLPQHQK